MAPQKLSLALLMLCALALHAVNGWWDTGHMLTSQIAWKHLNSAGISSPELLQALDNAVNSLVSYSPASNTFVTAACWMDDIKNRNLRQFSNWHFINLPICEYPDTSYDACNGTSVNDVLYSGDEEVIWAITQAMNTMKGAGALGFERGFALRNLLHLVGDLHQPLHTVALFSPMTPYGDEGGNLFPVQNISYADNLHKLWDSGIGQLNNTITRPLNNDEANYLSNLADQLIARTANLTANETLINVTAWALESRTLAIQYVYDLPFNSTPSAEYMAKAWEVVQDQLGLGGYRLALILKQFTLCSSATNNCPEEPQGGGGETPKEEKMWKIVGIVLAVVSGVSLLVNIVLIVRSRRASYEPVR